MKRLINFLIGFFELFMGVMLVIVAVKFIVSVDNYWGYIYVIAAGMGAWILFLEAFGDIRDAIKK